MKSILIGVGLNLWLIGFALRINSTINKSLIALILYL
jgi:hypothetical protein